MKPEAMKPVDRRTFLKGTGSALAAASLLQTGQAALAAEGEAASIVPGKDPRLIVHTHRPPVLETPLALLSGEQITPIELLFVRNVQQPPHVAGNDPLAGWKIELSGHLNRPQTLDAALLRNLPRKEVEMVVQCSGNSRKLFAQAAPTRGTQWGRGAMGNVRFAGVRLATLFDHLGVRPLAAARFLSAEGRDESPTGQMDFEHSLPLDETVAKSLLALELNGQPLPVIHGGPVRLVTPGYYGTMHVKWLTRLRFDEHESNHTSHIPDYRTPIEPIAPGEDFNPTYENSEPNWRMRLKSVVLSPATGAQLARGKASVVGVAFNDGMARIECVLVSTDAGATWQQARMETPESPYAWYRWQADIDLPQGQHQIWARAVDALGRTQPLDGSVHWNPQGYTWNGVEKIDVTVG